MKTFRKPLHKTPSFWGAGVVFLAYLGLTILLCGFPAPLFSISLLTLLNIYFLYVQCKAWCYLEIDVDRIWVRHPFLSHLNQEVSFNELGRVQIRDYGGIAAPCIRLQKNDKWLPSRGIDLVDFCDFKVIRKMLANHSPEFFGKNIHRYL